MRAEIVKIKKDDFEKVEKILLESWGDKTVVFEKMEKIEASLCEGSEVTYFVHKEENGEIGGVIGAGLAQDALIEVIDRILKTKPQKLGEILCFYVAEKFKGKGVGTGLFQEAAWFLLESGFKDMALSSGFKFEKSFNFYYQWFIVDKGNEENYYKDGRTAKIWHRTIDQESFSVVDGCHIFKKEITFTGMILDSEEPEISYYKNGRIKQKTWRRIGTYEKFDEHGNKIEEKILHKHLGYYIIHRYEIDKDGNLKYKGPCEIDTNFSEDIDREYIESLQKKED